MVTVTPSPLAGILQPTSMRSVDSSPSHSHSFSHSQMSRNSSRKSNNSVNCKLDGMSLCSIRDNHYNTILRNTHAQPFIEFIFNLVYCCPFTYGGFVLKKATVHYHFRCFHTFNICAIITGFQALISCEK